MCFIFVTSSRDVVWFCCFSRNLLLVLKFSNMLFSNGDMTRKTWFSAIAQETSYLHWNLNFHVVCSIFDDVYEFRAYEHFMSTQISKISPRRLWWVVVLRFLLVLRGYWELEGYIWTSWTLSLPNAIAYSPEVRKVRIISFFELLYFIFRTFRTKIQIMK